MISLLKRTKLLHKILFLFVLIFVSYGTSVHAKNDVTLLDLKISVKNDNYVIGEPILFDITLKNNTNTKVQFVDNFDTSLGFLQLMVSFDGYAYKKYNGPGFGIKRMTLKNSEILPGGMIVQSVPLFYNHYQGALPDELSTFLAVPESNVIHVKAVLNLPGFQDKIESNLLPIQINEPKGTDASAWLSLNHEEIIYFIHTGNALGSTKPPIKLLQDFLVKHPNSIYSKHVNIALKKNNISNLQLINVQKNIKEHNASINKNTGLDNISKTQEIIKLDKEAKSQAGVVHKNGNEPETDNVVYLIFIVLGLLAAGLIFGY